MRDLEPNFKPKQATISKPLEVLIQWDKYKLVDTKEYNYKIFYFYDAPTHRNRLIWHNFSAACRIHLHWLKSTEKDDKDEPMANIVKEISNDSHFEIGHGEDKSNSSNITALLVSAMNLAADNRIVKHLITDAIKEFTASA